MFLKGLKIKGMKRKSTCTREPEEKNLGWQQRRERERKELQRRREEEGGSRN